MSIMTGIVIIVGIIIVGIVVNNWIVEHYKYKANKSNDLIRELDTYKEVEK